MSPTNGMGPMPADDVIPVQVSDTVTRGTVQADVSRHRVSAQSRFRRRCDRQRLRLPRQAGAGADQTSWCSVTSRPAGSGTRIDPMCSRPTTAIRRPSHRSTRSTPTCAGSPKRRFRKRGGKGDALPGMGAQAGRGRVDLRFAVDNDGELYILTKSDGMIRKVVGARRHDGTAPAAAPAPAPGQRGRGSAGGRCAQSCRLHARVDRGREARLRRQLRRLSRPGGAGCGQGRHDDLDHRGAARQAATGSHR